MIPEEQYQILKTIAKDMMNNNYTAEDKDYILSIIEAQNEDLIEKARLQYPAEERPKKDELLNKLAGHALLDRSTEDSQGIGFVNEFVLGNFCAEVIIEEPSQEWAGDERFIEPSVISYLPRSKELKKQLWQSLGFRLNFVDIQSKIIHTLRLANEIPFNIQNETVNDITFQDLDLGRYHEVEDTVFVNCTFDKVVFHLNLLKQLSFLNCRFYECRYTSDTATPTLKFYNCVAEPSDFLDRFSPQNSEEILQANGFNSCELYILEKFLAQGTRNLLQT